MSFITSNAASARTDDRAEQLSLAGDSAACRTGKLTAPRRLRSLRLAWAVGALALSNVGFAQITALMTGLNNPRGLAFGPDGALYVTEAGTPFTTTPSTPFITVRGQSLYYGTTGSISKFLNGVQSTVVSGLPMLFNPLTGETTGAHGIGVNAAGDLYFTVGLGADPAVRNGTPLASLGQLMRLPAGGGALQTVADVAAFERSNNPAGGPFDSNPFQLAITAGGVVVADAGANAILNVGFSGGVSLLTTVPPLPSGPDAVPTGVAIGADGAYYFSQLTGFPFPLGAASVFRYDGSNLTAIASGFTNAIDIEAGPNGKLYVLEHAHNSLLSGDPTGGLWELDPTTGTKNLLLTTGLVSPTALAIGRDGTFYIANQGNGAGAGQVITFRSVPDVGSSALLVVLAGLWLIALRRVAASRSLARVTA